MKESFSKVDLLKQALKKLEIDRLVLSVHDQSFPSYPDEDIGRGTPYSRGGRDFLQFIQQLGFTIIQFGPQGKTSRDDLSPYNSTIFTRNLLSLSPSLLSETVPELFGYKDFERILSQQNDKLQINYSAQANSWDTINNVMTTVYDNYCKNKEKLPSFVKKFRKYVQNLNTSDVNWFERDSIYNALTDHYGTDDWRLWNGPDGTSLDSRLYGCSGNEIETVNQRIRYITETSHSCMEKFALGQFLLEEQHNTVRNIAHCLGLRFYGDLQIGYSHQDIWSWNTLFLPGYLLGAPPSRSNPEGQPWGYPVLNPELYFTRDGKNIPGPALQLIKERVKRLLNEFDGLRIDHPHGLVCPWVYRSDIENLFTAVQNGARLFSAPGLPDHPVLDKFSIVKKEQINSDSSYVRYGDEWEQNLTQEQVDRYAIIIDLILELAYTNNIHKEDVLCEVLSTWPNPLRAVMTNRGLGRFCVTQKSDPNNPDDIYRRENTAPQDWIMAGNHDTKPLLLMIKEKKLTPWYSARSKLLADELSSDRNRESFIESLRDPFKFRDAMLAELFLGPARNVLLFFTDLFGMQEIYNKPGIIDPDNWKLRIPDNYKDLYSQKCTSGEAPDLARILSMALKVRFYGNEEAQNLADKLSERKLFRL